MFSLASPDYSKTYVHNLGRTDLELPDARKEKVITNETKYVDSYPMIWNKFKQSGYVTLFAEDKPQYGTFEMRLNGFKKIPVDHYLRPFWMAANNASTKSYLCIGTNPTYHYTVEYVKDFFIKYSKVPKFAFGFHVGLSHGENSPAQLAGKMFISYQEEIVYFLILYILWMLHIFVFQTKTFWSFYNISIRTDSSKIPSLL